MENEEAQNSRPWLKPGKAHPTSDGGKCPVCRGTGWELYQKKVEGYEHLLDYARPCTACHGGAVDDYLERQARAGVPNRYTHAVTLADFRTDVYGESIEAKMKAARSMAENFNEWAAEGQGLYIYSATKGSGKTFLASCICNEIMKRNAAYTRFVSVSELLDISKGESERTIADLSRCRLLVLDDIGAKIGSTAWLGDVIFQIVDARYRAKLSTIYTSNIKVSNLPFDARVIDRINATSFNLSLPEVPVRLNQNNSNKKDFLKKIGLMED